ncbi:MAG: hypothetical protein Q7R32_13600 [Dehalococcoidia bacterium]|nr:hypothetical protein [Dehalococcoidia bacterium]
MDSSSDSDLTKPEPGASDAAHSVVKAGLSAIPFAGGPAAELFSAIITPPLSKRRDEWIESIVERLKGLEEKVDGFSFENLSSDETFITTLMHASQAAIRSHQEEKLEALRNAVVNVAARSAPEEDLQLMFLDFVDTFTPWHLRILKFLDDPKAWGEEHGINYPNITAGSPAMILESAFLDLTSRKDFYGQVVRDLHARGLLSVESLGGVMTREGVMASRTTGLGRQFLQFISL